MLSLKNNKKMTMTLRAAKIVTTTTFGFKSQGPKTNRRNKTSGKIKMKAVK